MGAFTVNVVGEIGTTKPLNPQLDNGPEGLVGIIGTLTGPASYDSGGSIVDLSEYLRDVVWMSITDGTLGLQGAYVAGANNSAALAKVKATNALPAHTHAATIPVTGGHGAVGTAALAVDTNALVKEEVGNTTLNYTIPANTVAAASSEASGNLSTSSFNFQAWGHAKGDYT